MFVPWVCLIIVCTVIILLTVFYKDGELFKESILFIDLMTLICFSRSLAKCRDELFLYMYRFTQQGSNVRDQVGFINDHELVLQQLKTMIDLTEPTVSEYVNKTEFETEAMQCETLILDTCENILASANDFVATCMAEDLLKAIESFDDLQTECVERFSPRIQKRVNRLGGTFTRCMQKTSMTIAEEAVAAIMSKIEENIKIALKQPY